MQDQRIGFVIQPKPRNVQLIDHDPNRVSARLRARRSYEAIALAVRRRPVHVTVVSIELSVTILLIRNHLVENWW